MELVKRTYFTMEEAGIDLNIVLPQPIPPRPTPLVEKTRKLIDLLNLRYSENWVVYTDTYVNSWDEEADAVPDLTKVAQWENRFKYIYETTRDRYVKLISLFEEQEVNLLNKVGSTSTTRFNDTPQNLGLGDTEDYTSTVSKTSTEVDPGEIIVRLDNIHKGYKKLYEEWANEFSELFGESIIL